MEDGNRNLQTPLFVRVVSWNGNIHVARTLMSMYICGLSSTLREGGKASRTSWSCRTACFTTGAFLGRSGGGVKRSHTTMYVSMS